ncbi:MAG: hypothetical protein Q8J97_10850, partial [Flavobacteriaceae bacterium]|nr:hypothetical protein [Flavobacteriaceae bacterium]
GELLENEIDVNAHENTAKISRIGELARAQRWLTLEDTAQILFCQNGETGSKFGQVAIKRNYLTPQQVESLLAMQTSRS